MIVIVTLKCTPSKKCFVKVVNSENANEIKLSMLADAFIEFRDRPFEKFTFEVNPASEVK